MPEVILTPLTETIARLILSGERGIDWSVGYPTAGDLEVAERILSGQMHVASEDLPWGPWVVREASVAVGGAGFHGAPDEAGDVEIGYGIAVEARGRGIATTAVQLLLTWARENGASRVVACTDPDNLPSQRVLEKCGLRSVGVDGGELRWAIDLNRGL